ncbi:Protein of unknown function [Variovorax sp. YR752]|uniref:DUF1302 domain-containing protein n=1 Tax=Variovorax sp. YR752 TaxID=1884383 RepID=UPI000BD856F5|nr:DUF1302 family protein [Variovorax sp. YR752]SOE06288.1 Protein of unknown function [Variovorax sp. YR752]
MSIDMVEARRGHPPVRRKDFRGRRARIAGAVFVVMSGGTAQAVQFDTDDPDLSVRWDNTLKYSSAFRVKKPSAVLIGNPNLDDGDRNFGRGLISSRVDILSELDVAYRGVGFRLSGAGWYDSIYNRRNDNDSPHTVNHVSVPYNQFVRDTRNQAGRDVQLLDAFGYIKGTVDDMRYTVRLGQHSVLYGETLYFGGNGIAGAQSPIDVYKLLSVPNTQFKEIVLPQPQISLQAQLNSRLSLGAYYQFHWEADRLPPAGSYFSNADMLQKGAEQILTGPGHDPYARTSDQKAKNRGQGGVQLRWRPGWTEGEIGFYAAQFNAKTPYVMLYPLGGTYNLLYPNRVQTLGTSYSVNVGDLNIATELSFRHNQPLVAAAGAVAVFPGQLSDNGKNPQYPLGNTLHWNASAIGTLPRTSFWDGGTFTGEIAFNSLLAAQKNANKIDPGATKNAFAMRAVFSPSYYQVLPGLDLNVPIGIGYNPYGRSSVINTFNGGATHGGDLSIGISGTYQQLWNFSLTYTHYLGKAAPATQGQASSTYTFKQSLKDRNFVALSVSRTF